MNLNKRKSNLYVSIIILIVAFIYFGLITYKKPDIANLEQNEQQKQNTQTDSTEKELAESKIISQDKTTTENNNSALSKNINQIPIISEEQIINNNQIPEDIKQQLENKTNGLPEDIKRAMSIPPKIVTLEEVNTPQEKGF